MTIDKQALREAAERAIHDDWGYGTDIFHEQVTPSVVLALLDELEHYKSREERVTKLVLDNSTSWDVLYEKLEAAERSIAEQSAIVAAAEKLVRCKGRYHSELNYRALAKLFGVITPDLPPLEYENVHYTEAAEVEISALRQRIAELEAKLSKPVLLPKTNGYWTEQEKAYEEAITLAKRQVRLAGFSVEDM
ncbi:ead/Ea22-like family protein [Salmonella enterica]|nr:ead/Ea22-like family protein [Salmonella enterica]